ncbi:cytochrome b N-terminal domain-containing protein [Halobellus salinisoli]|uniref:cytochrome b N-terminal domain-containing protein n=1 Tax=Halobellus salinisoli TaxID=3108500 RepID=UPI0030097914
MSQSSLPHSTPKVALVGLVTALALVDVALLAVSPTTSQIELLRLLLAVGGFGAVVLALVAGIDHNPRYALGAALSVPFVALYAYTGLVLPWTQLSFTIAQAGIELALSVPVVGDPLASALFGGSTISQATLQASFRYHYALVALALVGVVTAVGTVGWRHLTAVRSEETPRS